MKIIHQIEKCIGCGSCVAICPQSWEMRDDGKANLINSKINKKTNSQELEVKEIGCNQEVAEICPVECIKIKNN